MKLISKNYGSYHSRDEMVLQVKIIKWTIKDEKKKTNALIN